MTNEVSIITPVYNGVSTIEEVIRSIQMNRNEVLEHIIVDDGSTDGTFELVSNLAKEDPKIRLISQANQGEASAVNNGIEVSQGKYFMIVNADDPLLEDGVSKLRIALDQNPQAVASYGNWIMTDQLGKEIKKYRTAEFSLGTLIGRWVCIVGAGSMIRKGALKNSSARNTKYRNIGDFEMWLRLSTIGPFIHVDQFVATWRNHASGATRRDRGMSLVKQYLDLHHEFFLLDNLPEEIQKYKRSAKAHMLYFCGLQKLFDRKVPGRRYIIKSWILAPTLRHQRDQASRSIVGSVMVLSFPISIVFARGIRKIGINIPPLVDDAITNRYP